MKRIKWVGLGVIALLIFICAGLLLQNPRYPQPPLYPNATNIEVIADNIRYKWITFQNDASPEMIYSYYTEILPRYGWTPDPWLPSDMYRGFGYDQPMFGPGVALYVSATAQELQNTTQITLHIILSGPIVGFEEVPDWQWGTPVPLPAEE
ncbi:MAG: hypothetical protein HC876_17615 [Chloroflexaceae bacterium]|nr:hypothetical protein [Chloroflexaceae bacterium]